MGNNCSPLNTDLLLYCYKSLSLDPSQKLELVVCPFLLAIVLSVLRFTDSDIQSVPITTDVVSSNLDQGEVCNIM
jgi:hypothetical protein